MIKPDNVIKIEIPPNTPCERLLEFPDYNTNGKPINTLENLAFLLDSLGLVAAQNQMNLEIELLKNGEKIDGSNENKRSLLISAAARVELPKSAIEDHWKALSEKNAYHPVIAFLKGGRWDGVERLKAVIDTLNARNKTLTYLGLSRWFVACIAALYEPLFCCKIVPVLQSKQSYKKTAFISRLADVTEGAFLEGEELNPDCKDSVLIVMKSWIVELGELERTSKNSQGSIKSFITKKYDTVRMPYDRSETKKKRQTLFIATVNGDDFLRDDTGSSRYCAIELDKAIDIDRLNEILGWKYDGGRLSLENPELLRQFWLEVKHMYDNGASWELTDEEEKLFSVVNHQYKYKDDIRHLVEEAVLDRQADFKSRWMKASELCQILKLPPNKSRQVGKALKSMVNEGLIESKEGRSRIVLYWLPFSKFEG